MPTTGETRPSVAVVVCAYTPRRLDQTLAAVEEARRQAIGPGDEVVLVVDHHDELLHTLSSRVSGGVRVVANTGERGLSSARNTGWRATSAEVVAFLDDDALPRPGAVAALRARFADEQVAVVGGAVHPAWEGGTTPTWFPPEFGWVVGCDYRGLPGDGGRIRNPIGACMAVRRGALETVGGFSTEVGRVGTLPVGCEETLLGIRIHQQLPHVTSVRDTAFAVDHHVPADRQDVRYFLRRCYHEGRSKALVSRAVGAGDGLSSERSYVLRTLTTALVRDAVHALRGERGAAARGALVVGGLATTTLGLLSVPRSQGRTSQSPSSQSRSSQSRSSQSRSSQSRSSQSRTNRPEPTAPVAAPIDAGEPVTVVVCTLGRDPRLVRTVEAILGQTYPAVDLVVVDNDPASGRTQALLADIPPDRFRLVPQPARGLSAARNAGVAATGSSLVAFTDDDAVPDPTWIAELVSVVRGDHEGVVAAVTGRVMAAETSTTEQLWFEEAGIFDKGDVQTTWSLTPRDPDHLGVPGQRSAFFPYTAGEVGSGNNMLFRTQVLRSLAERRGIFDEALGAGSPTKGGEDLDIYRRVILAGHVIVYTPDAVVRHYHRDTYTALRQQIFGHGTGMAAVLTKIVLGGGRPARAVLGSIPSGAHMLLSTRSAKNERRPADMPRSLIGVELMGYLVAPVLFVRSATAAARRLKAGRT